MSIDYIIFTILGGLFVGFIIFTIIECIREHFLNNSSMDDPNYKKYKIIATLVISIPLILLDFLFNSIK